MNIHLKTRRQFLKEFTKNSLVLGSLTALASCASIDDYLFDDTSDLDREAIIIGGGISGLYCAHLLRAKQHEFRLYEASTALGGRIKSFAGKDFGANTFSPNDMRLNKLVDSLKLPKVPLDRDQIFFADGMGQIVERLGERTIGLLPYRSFRMRWELIEIQKLTDHFELTFERPDGQRKVRCKKLVITLPPSQWSSVKGLMQLPEMAEWVEPLQNMQVEHVIRLVLPTSSLPSTIKTSLNTSFDDFKVRIVVKKHRHPTPVELDVIYGSNLNFSIDYVYSELKKRVGVNYPFNKLSSDQYYGWNNVNFIKGAYFKIKVPPGANSSKNFKLAGDSVFLGNSGRIESALASAELAVSDFI